MRAIVIAVLGLMLVLLLGTRQGGATATPTPTKTALPHQNVAIIVNGQVVSTTNPLPVVPK